MSKCLECVEVETIINRGYCKAKYKYCEGLETIEPMTKKDTTKKDIWVNQLRAVGESLIKNAESIVGSEEYKTSLEISIIFDVERTPVISVKKDILPERFAEDSSK